jgi:hypothetical protein
MIDNKYLTLFRAGLRKNILNNLNVSFVSHIPVVTQDDVKSKYINRYFVRSRNYLENIIEINESDYKNLNNNFLYITVAVKWKIIGKLNTIFRQDGAIEYGVIDLNKKAIQFADLTFISLGSYINDYSQLWVGEKV